MKKLQVVAGGIALLMMSCPAYAQNNSPYLFFKPVYALQRHRNNWTSTQLL